MTTTRRAFAALIGLFAASLTANLAVNPAAAESYPNRTVTIVVTSAPGGLTDVLSRAVGQRLSQLWGQPLVIENKGGAGHSFAATAVKAAAPDGYTLLATETGMFTIQPFLHSKGKLAYDAVNDFIPIAGFASIPMALLVNPSVPAKSVKEVIALAKDKPGTMSYGTAGLGTAPHMGALLVPQRAVSELQGSYQVAVVDAANKVAIRNVTVGDRVGRMWVIADGLKPGERIVAEGVQKVGPGAEVDPKPYTPPKGK